AHFSALFALTSAIEREAELVGSGSAVGFGLDSDAKHGDGFQVPGFAAVDLAEVDVRTDIARVDLKHPLKRGDGVFSASLGFGYQANNVVRLRNVWEKRRRGLRLPQSILHIRNVVESYGEIYAGDRERWIELKRSTELISSFLVFELFEQRTTTVVPPIGVLASRGSGLAALSVRLL